jgi:hypothetical protein
VRRYLLLGCVQYARASSARVEYTEPLEEPAADPETIVARVYSANTPKATTKRRLERKSHGPA